MHFDLSHLAPNFSITALVPNSSKINQAELQYSTDYAFSKIEFNQLNLIVQEVELPFMQLEAEIKLY